MTPGSFVRTVLRSTAFLALLLVTGCPSPVGQIKDDDYVWSQETLKMNYQQVYRNVLNGYRTCMEVVPAANLYTDIKKGDMVFYLPAVGGGNSSWVHGKASIDAIGDDSSKLRVGVIDAYDAGRFRALVLQWAHGDTACEPNQK